MMQTSYTNKRRAKPAFNLNNKKIPYFIKFDGDR